MKKYKFTLIAFIFIFFYFDACFGQYAKLFDFTNSVSNGCYPKASLITDGTYLYGMTTQGGTKSCGVIYKIKLDGSDFSKIHDFEGMPDGNEPHGCLISDGIFLYGMTYRGGINNMGTIFKIKPDGSYYAKILDFSGTANGNSPDANLLFDGSYLYGMTIYGGLNNLGVVFKIKPDGSDYSKLLNFAGISNGKYPKGSLVTDGTYLYGSTSEGGSANMGTLFRIKYDGSDYAKLLDFAGQTNGSFPLGTPVYDAPYLYTATKFGGNNFLGTVIKIKTDGTGFVKIRDFINIPTGLHPHGSLLSDGTFLYGATLEGGTSNFGVLYKIKTDGSGFAKLLDFAGVTNGSLSYGSYIIENNVLYGLTSQGGLKDLGTIFKYGISSGINNINATTDLFIYPNPGSNQIIVNNPPPHSKIILYDIIGKPQIEKEVDVNNTINTQNLKAGIYFYKLIDSKGKIVATGKWVKGAVR